MLFKRMHGDIAVQLHHSHVYLDDFHDTVQNKMFFMHFREFIP